MSVQPATRDETGPSYIRISEASERMGVSRSTIYRWRQKGLRLRKVVGCTMVRVSDLNAFIEEHGVG